MQDKSTIFLTGATGLLGSYLLKLFLKNDHKVYVLARGRKDKSARQRVHEFVAFWDEDVLYKNKKNLKVIEGDIIYPNLGINSSKLLEELITETEIIYHSAALAKLRAPLDTISKINIEGTKNVMDFALKCKKKGKLKKVNHISTAYVAGTIGNINFLENMRELGQGFHNDYEQTKYEAEIVVQEYQKKGLNISIFRPSLVMGDSVKGKTTDFRLFYEPLHFFSQEIYDEFPVDVTIFQNMINIDTVARGLFLLGDREKSSVYHITSPEHTNIEDFLRLSSEFFRFKIPELIPLERFPFNHWTPVQKMLADPFLPYFNYKTKFISEKTQDILTNKGFVYPNIDGGNFLRVFEYCIKRKFIRR